MKKKTVYLVDPKTKKMRGSIGRGKDDIPVAVHAGIPAPVVPVQPREQRNRELLPALITKDIPLSSSEALIIEVRNARYGTDDTEDLVQRLAATIVTLNDELAVAQAASKRLATVVSLLHEIPMQSASSAEEPEMTIHIIDLTKVLDVAEGSDHPDNWISVPCPMSTGTGSAGYAFDHSPHHWNVYDSSPRPVGLLRTPHYCDGVRVAEGE